MMPRLPANKDHRSPAIKPLGGTTPPPRPAAGGARSLLLAAAASASLALSAVRLRLDSRSLAPLAAVPGGTDGGSAAADRHRRPPSADDVLGLVCREARGLGASFWDLPAVRSGIAEAASRSLHDCWTWDEAFTERSAWGDRNTTIEAYTNRTGGLLAALPASRMRRAVRTRGRPAALRSVLEVVLRRLSDPEDNPPLKVAVFGGSVTYGTDCMKNDVGLPDVGRDEHLCAWPGKLERLLDGLLGGPLLASAAATSEDGTARNVVRVTNFAVGGTDSDVAASIVEFDVIGSRPGDDPLSSYDVVVSSFAANDGQAEPSRRGALYGSMQRFVRLVSAQRPCDALPLVVMVEDVPVDTVLGTVRDGLRHAREMAEVSSRLGMLSVSYADLVREDAWLGGTRGGPVAGGAAGVLHPGAFFHAGLAWTVGHALLEGMLGDGCDEAEAGSRRREEVGEAAPFPPAWFVPPAVREDTTPAQELVRYERALEEQAAACEGGGGDGGGNATSAAPGASCTYKWLADRQSAWNKEAVRLAVSKVATSVDGWEATGFPVRKPRRTWQASGTNATFVIQLDPTEGPIDRLLILYIRSYGKLWENSRLLVTVEGRARGSSDPSSWGKIAEFDLPGVHGSETSVNYLHRADLGESLLVPGGGVRATFRLVNGTVFQINGLALCRSGEKTEGG